MAVRQYIALACQKGNDPGNNDTLLPDGGAVEVRGGSTRPLNIKR